MGSAEGSALLRGLEVEDLGFYFVFRKAVLQGFGVLHCSSRIWGSGLCLCKVLGFGVWRLGLFVGHEKNMAFL